MKLVNFFYFSLLSSVSQLCVDFSVSVSTASRGKDSKIVFYSKKVVSVLTGDKNIRESSDNFPQNEELMLKFEEFTTWFKSQFKKQKSGQFARFYASKEMVSLVNENVVLVL